MISICSVYILTLRSWNIVASYEAFCSVYEIKTPNAGSELSTGMAFYRFVATTEQVELCVARES